ncbi:MAG: hypothetical protein ACE5HQ_12825 [Gemmatimonadota bacterium]
MSVRRRSRRGILTLMLLAGCAGGGGPGRIAPPRAAVLEVTNRNWETMHVYVIAHGQRYSMGQVGSQQKQTFELGAKFFVTETNLVFVADPIGSVVAYVSDPVLVVPGDRVEWRIENNLALSSIFISR